MTDTTFQSGRFVLTDWSTAPGGGRNGSYVTSFDTWEEAEVAFPIHITHTLFDLETGREWFPGSQHVWEEART